MRKAKTTSPPNKLSGADVAMLAKAQHREDDARLQDETAELLASLDSLSRFYRDGGNMTKPRVPRPYGDDADMIRLLKAFRQRLGYTQENFAQIFGINLKTLQRWEAEGGPIADSLKTLVHGILAAPGVIAKANAQPNLSRAVQQLLDEPNASQETSAPKRPPTRQRKDKSDAN